LLHLTAFINVLWVTIGLYGLLSHSLARPGNKTQARMARSQPATRAERPRSRQGWSRAHRAVECLRRYRSASERPWWQGLRMKWKRWTR